MQEKQTFDYAGQMGIDKRNGIVYHENSEVYHFLGEFLFAREIRGFGEIRSNLE